jgi:hypothetical protein
LSDREESFRHWFEGYLMAFNHADFAAFSAYYADDVIFAGQAAQVVGRQSVVDFYRRVRRYLDERVELLTFVGAPGRGKIVAELRTTLVAVRAWPDMPTGAMREGDTRTTVSFAIYELAGDRFARIRTARFARFEGTAR